MDTYGNFPNLHLTAVSKDDDEIKIFLPIILNPATFNVIKKDWNKLYERVISNPYFYRDETLDAYLTSNAMSEIFYLISIIKNGIDAGVASNLEAIGPTNLFYVTDIVLDTHIYAVLTILEVTIDLSSDAIDDVNEFYDKLAVDMNNAYPIEKLEKIFLNDYSNEDKSIDFLTMTFGLANYAYINCFFYIKQLQNALDLDDNDFFNRIFDNDYISMRNDKDFFAQEILDATLNEDDSEFDKGFITYIGLLPLFLISAYYDTGDYEYHIINMKDPRDTSYDECKLVSGQFGYNYLTYMSYLANSTISSSIMVNKFWKRPVDDIIHILEFMKNEYYASEDKDDINEYESKMKTLQLHIQMCKINNIGNTDEEFIDKMLNAMEKSDEKITEDEKEKIKKDFIDSMKKFREKNKSEEDKGVEIEISSDSPIETNDRIISMVNDIVSGKELY